jgi:hypothetical protein
MHSILRCEDAQRTFSTLTRFWRIFSTLTVESFHDYGRLFYPLKLILFHDYKRSHRSIPLEEVFLRAPLPTLSSTWRSMHEERCS